MEINVKYFSERCIFSCILSPRQCPWQTLQIHFANEHISWNNWLVLRRYTAQINIFEWKPLSQNSWVAVFFRVLFFNLVKNYPVATHSHTLSLQFKGTLNGTKHQQIDWFSAIYLFSVQKPCLAFLQSRKAFAIEFVLRRAKCKKSFDAWPSIVRWYRRVLPFFEWSVRTGQRIKTHRNRF